jgi:membrane-associated protease RseP (regulator of RpoE activity)
MGLLGIVLFALLIFVSVCLHEAGHMLTAKRFGMKVTRYFAGFGPTLFSFRRGETEYGLKALPLGGFVKIVGMTPQDDDVAPEDEPRAMWRFPVWKRTVVMAAGSVTHFLLAFVLMWVLFAFVGTPMSEAASLKQPATITLGPCVPATDTQTACQPGDRPSPAARAGLHDGDTVVALNGTPTPTYQDLLTTIRSAKAGPATVTYKRDGVTRTVDVTLVPWLRHSADDPKAPPKTVAALGVGQTVPMVTYGPVDSVGRSASLAGQMFTGVVHGLAQVPQKVPALWNSLSGAKRDPNTPVSMVGASRLGGEAASHGQWAFFLYLLIMINFFVGIFNLLPLLPLDGGHIAIAWFERIRAWFYARMRRPDPGRVDYYKLMPVTYVVIFIVGGFSLLTIAADIVNPITLFGK